MLSASAPQVGRAASLASVKTVPGEATDKSNLNGASAGANVNRLGGFFSDLYYDRFSNVFYGLVDRGPGGGTIGYDTRVEKFVLDIDPVTGAASNLRLLDTIQFTIPAGKSLNRVTGPANFNGLDPVLDPLNGDAANLGRTLDPEGFAIAPNGDFYVSDEYGPSVYEFRPDGTFLRAFTNPANLLPYVGSSLDFSALDTPTTGRQANRGFEGLAISPDGSRLFAVLQDPLSEEGSDAGCVRGCTPPGRFSRNLRIVAFDTVTGTSRAQYIYQVEDLSTVNARVPTAPFNANAQGTSIGVSSIIAINDHEFLVLERDNRGLGVGDPVGATPVSSKRVYRIDLSGATDVSNITLAGTNSLPGNVIPASKTLYIDMAAAFQAGGYPVPEKIEGVAIGPQLADGSFAIIAGTDNDFSVTQNDDGVQFDVCTDGSEVAIDSGCPSGSTLIPTFYFSFKTTGNEIVIASPIQQLLDAVTGLGLSSPLTQVLGGTLRRAQDSVSAGRSQAACRQLGSFAFEVRAFSHKFIDSTAATRLQGGAAVAEQSLGCRR